MIALWGVSTDRDPAKDLDGDFLPDSMEATLVPGHPYDPTKRATYIDAFGYNPTPGQPLADAEDYALRREPSWTNGFANAEDWANPGKQHF